MQASNQASQKYIPLNTDQAIILRNIKLSETSVLVHLLTQHNGLLKVSAKGARSNTSKFKGKLDLFFSVEVSWRKSKSSEIHYLTEISPQELHEDIRKSYTNLEVACYFSTLIEKVTELESPEEQVYSLLKRGLNHLNTTQAKITSVTHYEKELCKILGIYNPKYEGKWSLQQAFGDLPVIRERCLKLLN